jgi:hypothetical protein
MFKKILTSLKLQTKFFSTALEHMFSNQISKKLDSQPVGYICIVLSTLFTLGVSYKLSFQIQFPQNINFYSYWVVLPEYPKLSALSFYCLGVTTIVHGYAQIFVLRSNGVIEQALLLGFQFAVTAIAFILSLRYGLERLAFALIFFQYLFFWLACRVDFKKILYRFSKIAGLIIVANFLLFVFYSLVIPNEFFQYESYEKSSGGYVSNKALYDTKIFKTEFSRPLKTVDDLILEHRKSINDSDNCKFDSFYLANHNNLSKDFVSNVNFIEKTVFEKIQPRNSENVDSLKNNALEIFRASQFGWTYHHLIHSYGPMAQISSGVSLSKVVALYGDFFTYMGGEFIRLFKGGELVAYVAYTALFYIIYYLIYLYTVTRITLRPDIFSLGILVVLFTQFCATNQVAALAMGLNPGRYVFSLINFLVLYNYHRKGNLNALIAVLTSACIGIVWSKDFGLFSALSVTAAVCYIWLKRNSYRLTSKQVLCTVTILSCIGTLYIFRFSAKNPLGENLLIGIATPQTSGFLVILLLLFVAMLWLPFATFRERLSGFDACYLYLVSYTSLALIYFIWYPSWHHLIPSIFPISLLLFIFVTTIKDRKKHWLFDSYIPYGFVVSIVFFCGVSFKDDYRVIRYYYTHKIFNWDVGYLNAYSTTNPAKVIETVDFINRNSTDRQLWALSYNDAFYSLASKKPLGFPYIELPSSLVSNVSMDEVINEINSKKPATLYVDNEFITGWPYLITTNGVINKHTKIGMSSYGKYFGYDSMLRIYKQVNKCYEIDSTNGVISSMKRKVDDSECTIEHVRRPGGAVPVVILLQGEAR